VTDSGLRVLCVLFCNVLLESREKRRGRERLEVERTHIYTIITPNSKTLSLLMTTTMTPLFALEQQVAIAAVRRACTLTTTVFNKLVAGETTIKDDKSPVTVADYSAQAVINTILSCAFPFDPIVGEEDSADLRDNTTLRARVVELASDVLAQPPRSFYPSSSSSSSSSDSSDSSDSSYFWEDRGGGGGGGGGSGEELMMDGNESAEWGLGKRWPADSLLEAIDRGGYPGGRTGRTSFIPPCAVVDSILFLFGRCKVCGRSIRSMEPKASCVAVNTPFVSLYSSTRT
jgi:hypothetical protein